MYDYTFEYLVVTQLGWICDCEGVIVSTVIQHNNNIIPAETLSFVFTHNNNNIQHKEELMMADTGKKFVIKVSTYLCFFV